MKGKTEITITITDHAKTYPETKEVNLSFSHYFGGLEEWIECFKNILYWAGYHPDTIEGVFDNETQDEVDD